jgi:transcriptional regulator with XRE-family HTH domain
MKTYNNDIKLLLGKNIRKFRKAKNWTQEQLGEQAEINYKFVGSIERGKQNPSITTLIRIAEALDVKLIEFFRFENLEKPNSSDVKRKKKIKDVKKEKLFRSELSKCNEIKIDLDKKEIVMFFNNSASTE